DLTVSNHRQFYVTSKIIPWSVANRWRVNSWSKPRGFGMISKIAFTDWFGFFPAFFSLCLELNFGSAMILGNPEQGGAQPADPFVGALLAADWENPWSPITFTSDLNPKDLEEATLYLNSRILRTALAGEGGTAATAKGNLNRAFANRMF